VIVMSEKFIPEQGGIPVDVFKKHRNEIITFLSGADVEYRAVNGDSNIVTREDDFCIECEYNARLPKGTIIELTTVNGWKSLAYFIEFTKDNDYTKSGGIHCSTEKFGDNYYGGRYRYFDEYSFRVVERA